MNFDRAVAHREVHSRRIKCGKNAQQNHRQGDRDEDGHLSRIHVVDFFVGVGVWRTPSMLGTM